MLDKTAWTKRLSRKLQVANKAPKKNLGILHPNDAQRIDVRAGAHGHRQFVSLLQKAAKAGALCHRLLGELPAPVRSICRAAGGAASSSMEATDPPAPDSRALAASLAPL